jgi:hypothetical protein
VKQSSETAAAAPEAGTSVATAPTGTNQSFPAPTIGQLKTSEMPTIPIKGLTPATSPKIRVNKANQGSTNDPFAASSGGDKVVTVITPQTIGKANRTTKPAVMPAIGPVPNITFRGPGKSGSLPPNRIAVNRPSRTIPAIPSFQPSAPLRLQPIAPAAPIAIASLPAPQPIQRPAPSVMAPSIPTPIEVAPQPPATALAEAVEITGIMGQSVIIKAPNENSARYVQAGARIAGGKVYVKSVQITPTGEPIVILEENGVEVTKTLGSRGPRTAALR